jgi:hypothetical protein
MDKQTIKHELFHILGDTYGLYKHCVKYNVSFKKMFDKGEVPLDLRGNFNEGTGGGCFLYVPDMQMEYLQKINATGALAPAAMDDDGPAIEAIQTRDTNPLYGSEILSDQDRAGFDLAPLDLGTVIEAVLVAKEYIALLGIGWHRFCQTLDAAALTHDELPLNAILKFDRVMQAIRAMPGQRNNLYTEARHAE